MVLNDFNRYVWVRDLSEGCFGKVKLAKDQLKAGKLVTLKYMKVPGKEEKDARRALCNEVKILRRVSQVNLLKINAVLQNEHSLVIVSEYLDGETLEQFMAKGQVDELTALEIVRSLALAIQETHHHSFVHRDLKPQNVIFKVSKKTQKRVWKLIDFGMSEDFSDRSKESLMKDRTGTVCYMAPEILNESLTGGVYDQRVDVYSLGVILFQLLTRRMPFQYHSNAELLEQIRSREVRSLRVFDDTIPAALDEVCLKCLAKQVSNRYATGQDLADALESWNLPQPKQHIVFDIFLK